MELLERQPLLDTLFDDLAKAAAGRGIMVLLGGEAGAGKTMLVQRFAELTCGSARVMIGACDATSSPRPLGPIFDVAAELGEPVRESLRVPDRRAEAFTAILEALSTGDPIVLIIEDVHWADDATIDVLRFLGRRISHTHAVVIVTYRDDEITGTHPLQIVLGDLATSSSVHRRTVELLSREAVRVMAEGSGIDPGDLYARTGGNPFYVTEVLGAGDTSVPPSVRDAVLARTARLPHGAREVLEVAAVIGGRIPPWLLVKVSGADAATVDSCIAGGLLQAHGDTIRIRHQLGLEAIYQAISPVRRAELHAAVLDALRHRVDSVADYPRLAHHADAAGDIEAVLHYAPEAGKRAAALGAHREAARQYGRVLHYSDQMPDDTHAEMLAAWFKEGLAIGSLQECAVVAGRLIDLAERRGDSPDAANWYAWKARALVHHGHNAEADAAIDRAISILEMLPPSPVHAHVWQIQSRLRMLNRDYQESIMWGQRAIDLAERFNLTHVHTGALNAMGSSRLIGIDEEQGRADLERGLSIARDAGLHTDIASLLTNLGSAHGEIYRFSYAERYLLEGLAFTREHDLDGWLWYITSWLALTRVYQGAWAEASDLAHTVLRTPASDVISRIMALIALGRVRARRGDPEVWPTLDEALELSIPTGTLQRLAPVHASRAEAAWLGGNRARAIAEVEAVFDLAISHRHPWHIGELGYWLWKAGALDHLPEGAAEPYTLQVAGDWFGAAKAWTALGCPYESARALADSDDEASLREAFAVFDRLRARPAITMVAQRLRQIGADSIPRGVRPATRAHDAMLTNREVEVLTLLAEGCTNTEIAAQLFLSPKTVERHVTAILAKLEVPSRREAARVAKAKALLNPPT